MPESNSGKYPKSHKAHTARPDQAGGQHQPKTADCPVPQNIKKTEQIFEKVLEINLLMCYKKIVLIMR